MRVWQAIVAFFVFCAFLALPAAADSTQGITDTTITIGNLSGPFSGPASVFTPLNYGAVAYLRYIQRARGGVDGRKFVTEFAEFVLQLEAKGIAKPRRS